MENTSVGETLKPTPTLINSTELATKARKIIREERIQSLPVTENRKLRGIIRARDLLRIASDRTNVKVSDLMIPSIITATVDWKVGKKLKKRSSSMS